MARSWSELHRLGAWHGSLLVIHRLWVGVRPGGKVAEKTLLSESVSWAITYASVTLGWGLFAMDLDTALFFYRRLLWQG